MSTKNYAFVKILAKRKFAPQDITFFLSEIRKILEAQQLKDSYLTLNFYCDWVLHSRKDRFSSTIKSQIQTLFDSALSNISNSFNIEAHKKATSFIYFKELRNELQEFLIDKNFKSSIVKNKKTRRQFIQTLVKILENQPMIYPIPEVSSLEFLPSIGGSAIMRLNFTNPQNSFHYYEIKNYY